MSPMKNPKFKVAASNTKKPKITFSRFIAAPLARVLASYGRGCLIASTSPPRAVRTRQKTYAGGGARGRLRDPRPRHRSRTSPRGTRRPRAPEWRNRPKPDRIPSAQLSTRSGREPITGLTVSDQNGTGVLDSPLVVALFLLTGYYALVALMHGARSVKRNPAVMGAALFAALSTVVTVWPLGGV